MGLGLMGSSLAGRFLDAGLDVSVWNRSEGRYAPLVERGAVPVGSPTEALSASPLTVICINTYASVAAVLADVDPDADLDGHTLANLTAGNSAEAAEMARRAHALGLGYLEGHIGVTPDLIGAETTSLMFCGPADLWEQHRERLMLLGPGSVYLGEDVEMNGRLAAGISVFFNTALVGFLEGLADARAVGIPLDMFLTTAVNRLITLRVFMDHSVAQAQTRNYEADLANVDAHFDGIKAHFPEVAARGNAHCMADGVVAYMQQAVDEGRADESIAVLLDLIERGR